VYDVLLGGKDNFGPDREQAARMLEIFPQSAELVRHARQFQARAVAWLTEHGVRQFLDLGCGLPTAPNTHETAQATDPEARIAYVDNDALVLSHAGNLLAQTSGVLVCAGDLNYPAEILYDQRIREFLDFGRPIAAILAMTLHFFSAEQARDITAQVVAALPAGSYLVLSVVGGEPELGDDLADAYTAADVHNHGAAGLAEFTKGLDLVEPGIIEARRWRAPAGVLGGRRGDAWAVVARVPGGA
jgi:O-methyltransferase involved in polyketide biosynthesis